MLGILAGPVLVKKGDDLPHRDLGRIVAKLLGNRDEPHAILSELADKASRKKRLKLWTTMTSKGWSSSQARSIILWNSGRLSSIAEAPGSTYSETTCQPWRSQ